jgi:ABC-type glycerol-3-phosphate transport system substrate-binding protein
MKIRTLSILALAALASTAACGGDDNANGDSTATQQDTSVVSGMDTIQQPMAVPTQDTVVKTTTTETDVDTVQGEGAARTDSLTTTTP